MLLVFWHRWFLTLLVFTLRFLLLSFCQLIHDAEGFDTAGFWLCWILLLLLVFYAAGFWLCWFLTLLDFWAADFDAADLDAAGFWRCVFFDTAGFLCDWIFTLLVLEAAVFGIWHCFFDAECFDAAGFWHCFFTLLVLMLLVFMLLVFEAAGIWLLVFDDADF